MNDNPPETLTITDQTQDALSSLYYRVHPDEDGTG